MTWVAAAVIGSAVVGGVISSSNTNKAISAEQNATNQADQTQMAMYNQNRDDLAPYRAAGQQALGQLQGMESQGFNYNQNADPGFQFQMQQGQDAINRATANRGGILAGSTLGALDQYSQGLGNSAYQSAFNRYQGQIGDLQSLAGLGAGATNSTVSSGTNTANQVGSNYMNLGAGTAAGTLSNSNNMVGSLNNMGNQFMNYSLMNQMTGNGLSGMSAASGVPGTGVLSSSQNGGIASAGLVPVPSGVTFT